jgi:2-oxoisovalerate dehydrogenase E2 component (dihydrolipoyl transacylase)
MGQTVFVLPDLGEGLEEGAIVAWLVAEGDTVELNQPFVEIETAKATVEIPSPFAGRIVTLHGMEGDAIPVGAALATFDVERAAEPSSTPVPTPARTSASVGVSVAERRPGPVRSTPPVRKLASSLGVDIETVRGTGPGGRVTADDVRRMADRSAAGPFAVTVSQDLGVERVRIDPHRRAIAESLARQASIPHVTTFRTVDCTAVEDLRRELEVSPLPIVVAALCRTIDGHPLLNAWWSDDAVESRRTVNVGVAVDTRDGLVVPVLTDSAHRGIGDIAAEIRRLAEAARSGSLSIEDVAPTATIAVTNIGSYGSEAGTPILAPGTSATLALGVIAPRALVVDGAVVSRPAATLSLTFDHRVMDGAAAGRALTDLVDRLQSLERLRDLPR